MYTVIAATKSEDFDQDSSRQYTQRVNEALFVFKNCACPFLLCHSRQPLVNMQLWILAATVAVASSLHEWDSSVNSTGECVYPGTCTPPSDAKYSKQAVGPKPGNQVFVVYW